MFNFEQLKEILSKNGYEYEQFLGGSGFSSVFLCQSNIYKTDLVIKRTIKHRQTDTEINNLVSLDHPNIVKIYDTFDDSIAHYSVMEYCSNGTIYKKGRLSYEKFIFYAKQILETIAYCHSNKIAHNEITPNKIYIDKNDRIKIADFGPPKSETNINSLIFHPPEVLLSNEFCSYKADIWALGITFFYMATGHYPFKSDNIEEIKQMILKNELNFFKYKIHPKIRFLISKMTAKNKLIRLSAKELLNLPIFSENKNYKESFHNQKRKKLKNLKVSSPMLLNCCSSKTRNALKRVSFNPKIEVN